MKAVILAAGEGTRLRPKTQDMPKPLVRVGGKPILTYCFETIRDIGLDEAVVVVGYERDKIIDHYGDSFHGLDIQYAHQSERKGLAHAVRATERYIDGESLVLNGDNIYSANLGEVIDRHERTDADITFPVDEVPPQVARGGAVCEMDTDGKVTGLVEKPDDPPSRCIPAACYVLPREIVPACRVIRPSERGEYELAEAIDLLIYSGYRVETVPFDGWRVNINTEEDIVKAERLLEREG